VSRGSRPRSLIAAVAGGAAALLVSAAAVAPASAAAMTLAADTHPVVPVVAPAGARSSVGAAAGAKADAAAKRKADLSRKRRHLPARPKPAPTFGPWRTALCSWYDEPQPLAGGGYLRPGMMIVAHKTLPFGTRIQFSYRGRSCVATVMDRGPYVGSREFDLGPGTAAALHFDGVDRVSYRFIH
jgi:rare lipoprotein A (peptidoglycan hydrolase)